MSNKTEMPTFENSFVSVVLANGYEKKWDGYRKVTKNNTHWITFYILDADEFKMYAYDSKDSEVEKIYDTGIIKTSESELQTLINILLINHP